MQPAESFLTRLKKRFRKTPKHGSFPERIYYPENTAPVVPVVPGYYGYVVNGGVPFPQPQISSSPYSLHHPPPVQTSRTSYPPGHAGYPSPPLPRGFPYSVSQIQLPYHQHRSEPPPYTLPGAIPPAPRPSHPRRRNISNPEFRGVHEELAEGAYYRRNPPDIVSPKSNKRRDSRGRGRKKRERRKRDESGFTIPAQPVWEGRAGPSKKYGLSYAGYPVELGSENPVDNRGDCHIHQP